MITKIKKRLYEGSCQNMTISKEKISQFYDYLILEEKSGTKIAYECALNNSIIVNVYKQNS